MEPLKCFKYSLVYAILYLVGYMFFYKYVLAYFIALFIILTMMCLYKLYKSFDRICYRPICNLLQLFRIALLGIKMINTNHSLIKCSKSQFGRKTKYNVFPLGKENINVCSLVQIERLCKNQI